MKQLYTATDLAAMCQVDLKTIHNWADRGYIIHFRTPGRHLRFKADDVRAFLARQGYTLPAELQGASGETAATAEPLVVARVDQVRDDGSVQLTVGGAHLAAIRGLVGGQVTIAGVVST